ncbi:hypothetical protein [Citricoccus sp. K5]|uniref:hypothetical protein n=1 Tax=Citricoccus sp. K5 TaxID=2653135 RepID=UPI0012F1E918|nr:hypothetical protein [Citricoccus sp. K5]VXA92536.1 conserved hypothetical protein [Citricoccus sp. K5]VXA94976.1 conserved hypothetical protein [Citricoccus sp. K5]
MATLLQQRIHEATTTAPANTGPGRVLLTIITPGQGSSGQYSAEMLERAAKDKAFPRGTQGHVNHTTAMEDMERPEGDLRNLALVLTEDARWTGDALVAEARVGSAWRDFVTEFGEFIGVSISAAAEISEDGTVNRLIPDPFNRVDLVTVAGRGGRIAEVLEAARVIESRSMRATETTNGDRNGWLAKAVYDTHGTDGSYVWFEDFDDDYVYYSTDERYTTRTYRQTYTVDGSTVTLEGGPEPVRRRTEFDPITPTDSPSGPAGVNEKKEGATMATIDDKELADLRESAGRVTALEKELKDERDAREEDARKAAKEAAEARKDKALAAVTEAFGKDAPKFYVTAAESAAKDDDYDHDAFAAMVTEAAAARESANGAGTPSGVGDTAATGSEDITPESASKAVAEAFGRNVKEA